MRKHDLRVRVICPCWIGLMLTAFTLVSCGNAVDRHWKSVVSENSVEAYRGFLEEYPGSEHVQEARFALTNLWLKDKKYDEIIAYYSTCAKANSQDTMSYYSVKIAELEKSRKWATSQYEASVRGDMKPMEGPMGQVYPVKGSFKVHGEARSALEGDKITAQITESAILYADIDRSTKVGWGVVATSGELVIPTVDYIALIGGKVPYFVESVFDASPMDYLNRYTRITIRKDKNHKFIIPAAIFSQYHSGASPMAQGSVYEMSTKVKDADSGLSSNIFTGTPDNRVDLYTVCYRTDGGSHRVGMRIGAKGEKLIYGAEYMTYKALEKSAVGGTINCRMQ
jgi:hypothetical protein